MFFQIIVPKEDAVPGAVIAIQIFGDFLGLWEVKLRPPPKATGQQKTPEYSIDYSDSQLPEFTRRLSGGSDKWLYVCPEYLSSI